LANEAVNGHDLIRARELLRATDQSVVQRGMRGWAWRYVAGRARIEEARILSRHDSWLASLAVSPDRQRLATISEDGVVKLRDLATEQEMTWAAHSRMFDSQPDWLHHDIVFTPDGSTLITAGEDGALRGWRVGAQPQRLFEIRDLPEPVNRLAISRDGTMLAGQGSGHKVYLWRLKAAMAKLVADFDSG
jgi:WD40 repeat protein